MLSENSDHSIAINMVAEHIFTRVRLETFLHIFLRVSQVFFFSSSPSPSLAAVRRSERPGAPALGADPPSRSAQLGGPSRPHRERHRAEPV